MPAPNRIDAPPSEGWHLDKKVPVGIIFAIILQCVSFTWYVGKLDSRMTLIETTQGDHLGAQRDRDDRQDAQNVEAIRLLREQLTQMNGKLDRLIERGAK